MVKPPKTGSKTQSPRHQAAARALRKTVGAVAASWGATVFAATVDIADLEAGAPHDAPTRAAPLKRAARLANLAMRRAVLPKTVGEARWGGRLAFAELPATTRAPPGPKTKRYEIVAGEWAGRAPGTPGEPSPYAAWRAVERDDVRAVGRRFFAALGEPPERCALAADVARGSLPDGLEFDKAFVAVGGTRVAALWMYLGRVWG